MIWFLAERTDCHFFDDIIASAKKNGNKEFRFLPTEEKETILVEKAGEPILFFLAGRQIVSKEGVEILSLASTLFLKDYETSADNIIKSINDSNGIAALNWAPGKWFFRRGKVIRQLLENQSPENLLICDTSLRTLLWPKPRLMVSAQNQGFKVIAGSDPLPFYGEENYVGSYGFCMRGEFDLERPADSIRVLLRINEQSLSLIGKRNNLATFCRRQYKILSEQRRRKLSIT